MALNEHATVAALDAARAVFRSAIEAGHGRVVDMAGAAVRAVFETASAAVGAALAIQAALESAGTELPVERRLRFRIGIHLGELIQKRDGTVHGDGVNIAARLQGLAEPGSVAISDAVRGAVGRRLGVGFDDMGPQSVKHVAEPVRPYRVIAAGATERPAPVPAPQRPSQSGCRRWPAAAAVLAVATAALGIWWTGPWINGPGDVSTPALWGAIILFHAVGPDPAHAAVADALTQPLTTNRSQRPRLTVTAPSGTGAFRGQALDANRPGRDLHVRYLVEGELMPQADKLLLRARLIEAETARQL